MSLSTLQHAWRRYFHILVPLAASYLGMITSSKPNVEPSQPTQMGSKLAPAMLWSLMFNIGAVIGIEQNVPSVTNFIG